MSFSANRLSNLQAPVYENCRMLSREGELLCFCDRAKVNWYLERGLGGDLDI